MTELWRHMIFEVTSKRDEVINPSKMLEWSKTLQAHLGAVQKLRNGQRGEGVADFVVYRCVYFGGRHSYVTADTQCENSKNPISFRCAVLFSSNYSLVATTLIVALLTCSLLFYLSILFAFMISSVCLHVFKYVLTHM